MSFSFPYIVELVVVAGPGEVDTPAGLDRLHQLLAMADQHVWAVTIAELCDDPTPSAALQQFADPARAIAVRRLAPTLPRDSWRSHWTERSSEIVALVVLAEVDDMASTLAPLLAHTATRSPVSTTRPTLDRRTVLRTASAAGVVLLVAACSGGKSGSSTSGSSTSAGSGSAAGAVPLAVEMTQGPYYLDLGLVRSDIREDRTGADLMLDLVVLDSTGKPVKGAAVDIWHCDANGVYSGFGSASTGANGPGGQAGSGPGGQAGSGPGARSGNSGPPGGPGGGNPGGTGPGGSGPGGSGPGGGGTATSTDTKTFLRGTQVSTSDGKLRFQTIYPGWYQGRNVHIHVMVHVGGAVVHTGQFFFDDAFTDSLYKATVPYSSRGARDTRNANDGIFAGGGDQSVLAVAKAGAGYATNANVAVKVS